MWLDNISQEAVNRFWWSCSETEPFPRTLERSIALALPLTVIKLPYLKLSLIETWLAQRGRVFRFNCQSRSVRGCLVAFGGLGLIFVDGTDSDDEQRFTLAHETAHFLMDYQLPRETAARKFGQGIIEVFDGHRAPSVTERVHSVLAGVSIGVYTKLMERNQASDGFNSGVWEIEDRADRVALALLAPPESVLAAADFSAKTFAERQASITSTLVQRFGLPRPIASAYGYSLLLSIGRGPSWIESLRLNKLVPWCSTGSGSDLVVSEVHTSRPPGRYRSLYCTEF
jgi:hypothetical protein